MNVHTSAHAAQTRLFTLINFQIWCCVRKFVGFIYVGNDKKISPWLLQVSLRVVQHGSHSICLGSQKTPGYGFKVNKTVL